MFSLGLLGSAVLDATAGGMLWFGSFVVVWLFWIGGDADCVLGDSE